MKFTQEQLSEAYKKLSPEIKAILGSEERSTAYQKIMSEFGLTVQDIAKVSDEAAPVICGLVHPNEFSTNLRRALPSFPEKDFATFIKKIDEALFAPLRAQVIRKPEESTEKTDVRPPAAYNQPPFPPRPISLQQPTQPTTQVSQKPQGLERTMPADLVRAKLEQSFRLPPETSTVTLTPEARSINQESGKQAASTVDPYREPIG